MSLGASEKCGSIILSWGGAQLPMWNWSNPTIFSLSWILFVIYRLSNLHRKRNVWHSPTMSSLAGKISQLFDFLHLMTFYLNTNYLCNSFYIGLCNTYYSMLLFQLWENSNHLMCTLKLCQILFSPLFLTSNLHYLY